LRGFGVALFAGAPLLLLAAPARADVAVIPVDVPADTATTAPVPSPLEGGSTTTIPPVTDPPPDTTVPDPVTTVPSTLPPVETTTPLTDLTTSTTTPTPDTTAPTTVTTTRQGNGSTPPVITPTNPPPGSGGSAGTGTGTPRKGSAASKSHDAAPLQALVQVSSSTPPYNPNVRQAFVASFIPQEKFVRAAEKLGAQIQAAFDPRSAGSSWGNLGSAAPRFGPWIVLVAMAWLVRVVIASILADRTAGPRRRRWTLL
jgi:hypothetical protein